MISPFICVVRGDFFCTKCQKKLKNIKKIVEIVLSYVEFFCIMVTGVNCI